MREGSARRAAEKAWMALSMVAQLDHQMIQAGCLFVLELPLVLGLAPLATARGCQCTPPAK